MKLKLKVGDFEISLEGTNPTHSSDTNKRIELFIDKAVKAYEAIEKAKGDRL